MRSLPAILFVMATCLATAPPADDADRDELPGSWKREEIEKATPPYGAGGRVYVLAWKIVEDARPLRVESCLVKVQSCFCFTLPKENRPFFFFAGPSFWADFFFFLALARS